MWKFITKRTLLMIPQLILLSMLVFGISKLMPGDPLLQQMQNDPSITMEMVNEKREAMGLNDPIPEQYGRWAKGAIKFDFGESFKYKVPVSEIVARNLGNTFFLGLLTLVITYLIAIPLGVLAGKKEGSKIDRAIISYTYFSLAIPTFVVGLLLLFIFGFKLGWFPTSGSVALGVKSGSLQFYLSKIYHSLLPAFSMAILSTATIVQYLRNEIIDVKIRDFIKTAKAKGASEKNLYRRHIMRNSLLPIASFSGAQITGILAGNIVIERIFGYQGIGQLFITSIQMRDTPVVIALVLLSGMLTLIGTLLSDIIMSAIDPRIRIK